MTRRARKARGQHGAGTRGTGTRGAGTRSLVTAAAAGYVANVAFGTAVAVGLIDNRRIRWVHHALYIVTSALTGAALAAGAAERRPAALALAPTLVPLIMLPRAGRGRRHVALAAAAAAPFLTALFMSWRRN